MLFNLFYNYWCSLSNDFSWHKMRMGARKSLMGYVSNTNLMHGKKKAWALLIKAGCLSFSSQTDPSICTIVTFLALLMFSTPPKFRKSPKSSTSTIEINIRNWSIIVRNRKKNKEKSKKEYLYEENIKVINNIGNWSNFLQLQLLWCSTFNSSIFSYIPCSISFWIFTC